MLHWVLIPQDPVQGSLHLFETQLKVNGQSWSIKHSGRHFGGDPNIPGKHEQTAWSLITLQLAFAPQGDGTQGDTGGVGDFSKIMTYFYYDVIHRLINYV